MIRELLPGIIIGCLGGGLVVWLVGPIIDSIVDFILDKQGEQ